ncbi:MarC family protein, partial [Citrobacter freundii]|uniref:MarC family protein n=1 Tax=Citrobacter freundii TaxID=546 RepID=UPI003C70F418
MIQTLFDFPVYFKFFIGLFALVNPVGIIPVFISMTSYQTAAARNKTNLTANLNESIEIPKSCRIPSPRNSEVHRMIATDRFAVRL